MVLPAQLRSRGKELTLVINDVSGQIAPRPDPVLIKSLVTAQGWPEQRRLFGA